MASLLMSFLFLISLPPTAQAGASGQEAVSGPRVVSIKAQEGVDVTADEYGSGERAVILAHGGRFDRASWKKQADVLAARGFRVLALDFRASVATRRGEETPCLYDAACLAQDVLAAVRHLRRDGAKQIAIIGASLGGGAAAQASIEAQAGEIDRIVLLAHMLIDQPERIKARKLFITARDDRGGSGKPRIEGIRAQFERAPQPKKLVILEGTAHAQFLFDTDQGPRLLDEILRFLSEP